MKALSAYTLYKRLGTILGICKKQDDQFEVQLAKATRLTRALACSNVSEKYACIHWNSCFIASIAFPLEVYHLTNKQLHDLQNKYILTVLNKMGFPRTYAHAIVFGPTTYGGISSIDLRIEQGIMIVTEIMRTLRTLRHGQDILRIFLKTFQHASGLSLTLLEYPDQRAPHLEGHYYVYLRQFLAEHKMNLRCECVDRPKLERENDIFLMDAVCARSKEELSDAKVRTINDCKYYLEVKCLSDICSADGHYIITSVWDGNRSVTQSQSRLEEILQDQPGNKEWAEWRKLLRSLCHAGSNQLIKSLGKWTTTIHSSQRLWPFYYSSTTNILYYGYRDDWHDNTKYQFDEYECNGDNVFTFVPGVRNVELNCIQNDAIPVYTASARHGWIICHFQTLRPQPTAPATPTDLVKFIKSQPAYILQFYANIKWEIPKAEMYKVLKDRKKI